MKTKTRTSRLNLLAVFLLFLTAHRPDTKAGPFPISTNPSALEFSGGIAFDGTNYLVGLMAGTNANVQRMSSNGTLLGSPVTVGHNPILPSVVGLAFGQTNYLVGWSDDSITSGVTMFGQFVTPRGDKFGPVFPFLQSQGTHGFQALSRLASDGTNFLAVWQDGATSGLYGQLVTAAGTLSDPEFVISNQQSPNNNNAVAFGKTNYLVVWQSGPGDQGKRTYGAFVSPSGAPGSPFQISQTDSETYNPLTVAFDGTNYLVAWSRSIGPGETPPVVYGRLVSQSGTFAGSELALLTVSGGQWVPSLAFDGANYLLAWSDGALSKTNWNNSAIQFRFFNRSASPIGPNFTVFMAQGTNVPLFAFNGLIFGGHQFAVAAMLGTVQFDDNGNFMGFPSGEVYGAFLPASTTAPSLSLAGPRVGAQFPLLLTGTPGINYEIQATTNVAPANWTALGTNSPTNGTFNFTDTGATNASRFYRAVKR